MSKGKAKVPFAREATGLVREIGGFTALAMVMSAVIGAGINGFAVQAYGYSATGNDVSPLLMVFLVAIPFGASAICLGIMSSAMPRSGGPYVIISRAVSPITGYLATWGSWVSIALSVGLLAQYDIYFWGTSLRVAGAVMNMDSLTSLGVMFQDIWPSIWLGVILVVIITLFAALGTRITGRVVQILFIIPLIGTLITIGIFLGHNATQFPAYWDAVFASIPGGSYGDIYAASVPYTPSLIASFAALPGIIFAYTAYYSSSYVGGEVKNPKRNMVRSTILGMFFIILIFVLYTGGLANAVGERFLYGYATYGAGVIGAPAILPLFAAVYAYSMPWLSIFIAVTGALWLLNDLPPFYYVATRTTFAWAFDRQFPQKFADVNERFHSPIWSVVLVFVLAVPAVFLSALTLLGSLFYITFIDCFTYLFICVAGLTFAKRFKSAYEKGAKYDKSMSTKDFLGVGFLLSLLTLVFGLVLTITSATYLFLGLLCLAVGGIAMILLIATASMREEKDQEKQVTVSALSVFGWVGIVSWLLMLAAMMYYMYTLDPLWYGIPDLPLWETAMILVTFAVGALIYLFYKWRNKRQGISVSEIYGEIPPE